MTLIAAIHLRDAMLIARSRKLDHTDWVYVWGIDQCETFNPALGNFLYYGGNGRDSSPVIRASIENIKHYLIGKSIAFEEISDSELVKCGE